MAPRGVSSISVPAGRVFWRLLVLIQLARPLCWAAGPSCYRLNRAYSPDDSPCNPSATESTCCGAGWACLENGLCRSTAVSPRIKPNIFSQGSCTDAAWKSNKCANPCNAAVGLTPCGGNTYCCGNCTCNNETATFDIPGKPDPFTTIGFAASISTSSFTSTFSSSLTSTFSSSLTSASSLGSSESLPSTSSTAAASSASSLDASGLSSSTSSSPSPSAQPISNSKTATKIGVGVGIPMAALAAVVVLFIWRERHWRKRMQDLQERTIPTGWGSENNPGQPYELLPKRVLHEMGSETSPNGMTELPSSR